MARRRFRFGPLLDAQRRDEAVCRARYLQRRAEAELARRRGEELARLLETARAGALADLERPGLRERQAYLGALERRARTLRPYAGEREALAAAARDDLLRAARARAALELLRDRQDAAAERLSRAAEERERDDGCARRATTVR